MDAANLQRIYDDSGRPGARSFRTAARRQGADITQREAQQFVAQQSTSQVLQQRLPSDGRVSAAREDSRWQLDLLDFSKRKKQPGGHKYVLTAIDVFSRFVWVEKLTDKTDAQVLAAYRRIIGRNNNVHPKEVSTDLGREFGRDAADNHVGCHRWLAHLSLSYSCRDRGSARAARPKDS